MFVKENSAIKTLFKIAMVVMSIACFSAAYADDATGMPGHKAGQEGAKHYKAKDYDAALPYLHVAAEWGFKDAQARLGQIYLKGLGSAEKNTLRGLAWLGTAASKPASNSYESMYEKALAKVSEENQAVVERTVEAYTQRFGSGAAAVTCKMVKPLGSNMSQPSCDYDAKYEYVKPEASIWSQHEQNAF